MKTWLSVGLLVLIASLFTWTAGTLMGKADSWDMQRVADRQRTTEAVLRAMAVDIAEIRVMVKYYMDKETADGSDGTGRP
tara:strand:+ start:936 stop:1175 length:240 start_codon:yes stop_codon:yes gene_type:complete